MSTITFTPINSEDAHGTSCSLLTINHSINILINCGWSFRYNGNESIEQCNTLIDNIKSINCILLTHANIKYINLLPYLYKHYHLKTPIYCTLAVHKMVQLILYDDYFDVRNTIANFDALYYNLDDIDHIFDCIHTLKYAEDIHVDNTIDSTLDDTKMNTNDVNDSNTYICTPYAAGHSIGGTIWNITPPDDQSNNIVIALHTNHTRERHLNAGQLDIFNKPYILITECSNIQHSYPLRKIRDTQLIDNIMSRLKDSGNILIPCDTVSRTLELLCVLYTYWDTNSIYEQYSLVYLCNESYNVLDFTRSLLEWCSDTIMKQFDLQRDNPFTMKHLIVCNNIQQINKLQEPYVILTTQATMNFGHSHQLLHQYAAHTNNLILLTQRQPIHTITQQLIELLPSIEHTTAINTPTQNNEFTVRYSEYSIEQLGGSELEQFNLSQQTQHDSSANDNVTLDNEFNIQYMDTDTDEDEDIDNPSDNKTKIQRELSVYERELIINYPGGILSTDQYIRNNINFNILPYIECKRVSDSYGELLSQHDIQTLKHTDQLNKSMLDYKQNKYHRYGNNHMTIQPELPSIDIASLYTVQPLAPVKTVIQEKSLPIQCAVLYIDYEGISDGKSIKQIISKLQPQHLILIHSTLSQCNIMKQYCTDNKLTNNIYTPLNNQSITIQTSIDIQRVQLSNQLYNTLQWYQCTNDNNESYDITWIDSLLHNTNNKLILQPYPTQNKQLLGHTPLYLGDLRFSELRRILVESNIAAEFIDGILVCGANGMYHIRKLSNSHVQFTGYLSDQYYQIRNLIYGLYQIV